MAISFSRMPRRKKVLFGISAAVFLYAIATSVAQYFLALVVEDAAPSYTVFGVIMGLPWLFSILTDIPAGAFADRFGRKRTIVLGLAGLGATGILLHVAPGLGWMFWSLVVFGLFEGLVTVSAMASVIAISNPGEEHRFIGTYEGTVEAGYVVGSLVAGFVVGSAYGGMSFLIFGMACFGAALFAAFAIGDAGGTRESLVSTLAHIIRRDGVYVSEIKEFFSAGRLAWFICFFTMLSGMWYEFLCAMEPVLINQLGISPVAGGLILSLFMAVLAFTDFPIGRWMDRSQRRYASLALGLVVGSLGIMLFGVATHVVILAALAVVTGSGMAFFDVALDGLLDSFSDHHHRGSMSGVWQASEDVGFVIGPVAGGILADVVGFRGSFFLFGSIFLVSLVWVVIERKHIRHYETHATR